ncbi:DNA polymerase III subunit beta [Salinactinospora qingdaonensis]|uniref:DNA polymerase III subunit beta n=1 Tax=Salinactinospora qingdaonensis TaxID=702744 RepID=UPI0031EFFF81
MRFRVDQQGFADAVAWTARALPSRPAVPVLAGMRLDLSDPASGRLQLSSFDYEVSARAAVDVAAVEAGTVLVSGRLLAEIVRNLPDRPVEVAADGPRVTLTCGGARFTLLTLPLEDYPRLPEMPAAVGSVAADAFALAARQVTPVASRDDTLPMLTGVHLSMAADSMTWAATDRYRIVVRELWWHPEHPDLAATALVPARTLAETARALVNGSNVGIALFSPERGAGDSTMPSEGMIGFDNAGRQMTTRLIDSEFVNYQARFPSDFSARARVPTAPLLEAVKRVALVAERGTPLRLSFSAHEVVLEAGSGDDAQALEAMQVEFGGDELSIAFNVQYLLDGLGAVDSEHADIGFTSPTKPAVISNVPADESDRPDLRYLVMPLRVS